MLPFLFPKELPWPLLCFWLRLSSCLSFMPFQYSYARKKKKKSIANEWVRSKSATMRSAAWADEAQGGNAAAEFDAMKANGFKCKWELEVFFHHQLSKPRESQTWGQLREAGYWSMKTAGMQGSDHLHKDPLLASAQVLRWHFPAADVENNLAALCSSVDVLPWLTPSTQGGWVFILRSLSTVHRSQGPHWWHQEK